MYAELHCLSNFSFHRGASHPFELVQTAHALGYRALAITDECTLAGVVRAYEAAREVNLPLIIGSEVRLQDGLRCVLLAPNLSGYQALSRLITAARRAAKKGEYRVDRTMLAKASSTLLCLWLPAWQPDIDQAFWLQEQFPERLWIVVELFRQGSDRSRLQMLQDWGQALAIPLVAAGDVHMHRRSRRALQDLVTAIRLQQPVSEIAHQLYPNGERHLRPISSLRKLYPAELLAESVRVAERCSFALDQLEYAYPREITPEGSTPSNYLRELTEQGMHKRWPEGVPEKVRQQIEHELSLIAEMRYEAFFLTVYDIVRFARSQGILCQGRGSAANSTVCFCLGITEVDPARMEMLFERFISKERNEPPDIDVDFEHDRREEVLQYVYKKYGRERAALAATVITYRVKSAVRDVAKALGFDQDEINRLSRALSAWDRHEVLAARLQEAGFQPDTPLLRRLMVLVAELVNFPRHLSQHVGGFVISDGPLHELVPVENAAMAERTVIQWDKDDLDTLGLLKVDCLGLGMLSVIHRAFDLLAPLRKTQYTMATIPAEDPDTYAMIQQADTIGVFQIESRAQMSMLPRLRPQCFYDLVIEVAIVRPGPIQGKMVHPYLRRRAGEEPISYPSTEVGEIFARTLGVPIFQEQVMQLAIVAAGFSPGEADQLRRSMAAWGRRGGVDKFEDRLKRGMAERGYDAGFADQVFEQIRGFGSYGFPESHAASFALLVYVSAWLKCHEPAAFCCALLNSQPMGFYPASQLIDDARRHGVQVLPPDVRYSHYDSHLVASEKSSQPAVRLGLRQIKGFAQEAATRIAGRREEHAFASIADLQRRCELDRKALQALTDAGALRGLAGHRHRAKWIAAGTAATPLLLESNHYSETVQLRPPTVAENVLADYRSLHFSLEAHPLQLLRGALRARKVRSVQENKALSHGTPTRAAGLVTLRQRPGTASGVTFLTIEDEGGLLNVVVWKDLAERERRTLLESRLLAIDGIIEHQKQVCHLIASRLIDFSSLLGTLQVKARDFR